MQNRFQTVLRHMNESKKVNPKAQKQNSENQIHKNICIVNNYPTTNMYYYISFYRYIEGFRIV